MAKTKNPALLRRRDRVRAAADLRGVPAGTPGKVILANGVDWIRYWVRFDNGLEMGSIHRDKLVRYDEWETYLSQQAEREAAAAAAAAGGGSAAGADTAAGGGDAGGAGAVTVNGVTVPPLLVDRTKAALARFGVSR